MTTATKEISCSICCTDVMFQALPCEHYFHVGCIEPWIKTHNTCPNCRETVQNKSSVAGANNDAEIRRLNFKVRELERELDRGKAALTEARDAATIKNAEVHSLLFRFNLLDKALENRKNALEGALHDNAALKAENDHLKDKCVAVNEENALLNGQIREITKNPPYVLRLRALAAAARGWREEGEDGVAVE